MFPGRGWLSFVINSTACSNGGSIPCPLPTAGALLRGSRPNNVSSASSNAKGIDAEFAYLMNITGTGTKTIETFEFYTGSDSNPAPALGTAIYIGDSLVLNYPGGSKYSWTLDVGGVSAPCSFELYHLLDKLKMLQ